MKVRRTRIAGAIANHTLSKGSSKSYAKEVAALLLADRRVGELDSLMRDVQGDWAQAGYVEILARSAHPLEADVKRDIATDVKKLFPTAKQVIVTEVRDPEVIGGVRINLSDRQLDLSVESKLNQFKQLTGAGKE